MTTADQPLAQDYQSRMNRALNAVPSMGGLNAQPLVRDQALAIDGRTEDDFPAGPQPLRMGSGDHLGPQFDPYVNKVGVPDVPAVHGPDKTTWYGKGDDDASQR